MEMARCRISGKHDWAWGDLSEWCRLCWLVRPRRDLIRERCEARVATREIERQESRAIAAERRVTNECGNEGEPYWRPWKLARQGGHERCYWCRELFHEQRPPTEDHVVPIANGGTKADGVVLSCQTCNGARGSIDFHVYEMVVEIEHRNAIEEKRAFRRPKRRMVGNRWMVTTMSRNEIKAFRESSRADSLARLSG